MADASVKTWWLPALGFGFLTFNYGMAIYRSNGDVSSVSYEALSYAVICASFVCLWRYENAEPGSQRRGRLKVAVWLLTTALTLAFSYKVPGVMPAAVAIVAWLMIFGTVAGADGQQPGDAAGRRRRGSFYWLTALGFAFLTFNSAMAVYRSKSDRWDIAFSYLGILALFFCLRQYQSRPPAARPLLPLRLEASDEPGRGGSFSWLTALGFGFLTFNSGMAIYRSQGDVSSVAFVGFSYVDLLLIVWYYRCFSGNAGGATSSSWRVWGVRASAWLLTALLVVMLGYKVAAVMPLPIAVVVWLMAAVSLFGISKAFFP